MAYSQEQQEAIQVEMYGQTEAQVMAAVRGYPLMYAAGILSDAQEAMASGDTENARQYMNKAKCIMFNEMDK